MAEGVGRGRSRAGPVLPPRRRMYIDIYIHTYIYIRISTVDSATVLLEAGLFLARQTGC